VIADVALQDIWHIANCAQRRRIILTRAIIPCTRVLYVNLARCVVESQKPARHSRHRVLLVVHVCDLSSQLAVDEIGERLVPDAGHAVADNTHGDAGVEMLLEEDAVEEGKRSTE